MATSLGRTWERDGVAALDGGARLGSPCSRPTERACAAALDGHRAAMVQARDSRIDTCGDGSLTKPVVP